MIGPAGFMQAPTLVEEVKVVPSTTYKQLKQGQAFQFDPEGAVFIRCRGGFRPGRGGDLIKFLGWDGDVYLWGV